MAKQIKHTKQKCPHLWGVLQLCDGLSNAFPCAVVGLSAVHMVINIHSLKLTVGRISILYKKKRIT